MFPHTHHILGRLLAKFANIIPATGRLRLSRRARPYRPEKHYMRGGRPRPSIEPVRDEQTPRAI